MKRVALAVLGVVVAVAIIVALARALSDGKPRPPASKPPPTLANPPSESDAAPEAAETDDSEVEVKELSFGDGSANQRSIRIEHPVIEVQKRLRAWLEPRESAAVATRSALDCRAQLARTNLISIVCVTMPPPDPDASAPEAGASDADADADADVDASDDDDEASVEPAANARYEALTLRINGSDVKELSLQDMLAADAGEAEVTAACKKSATAPLTCIWPPTTFALGAEGALFICHESHCVTIEGQPDLVRPELR